MERRLKSLNSILGKLQRRNLPLTVDAIKDNLFDVAGVRVICNYRDDVYSVANYLSAQSDIQVLRVKDYIKNPKAERLPFAACHLRGAGVPVIRTALHAGRGSATHHRHGLLGEPGACAAV